MSSLIAELRRRNVLRVAATYAVVAWIIIEAGSVLLPTFGASEMAFKVYVVVVVIGFLASLIVAWIFEVTPEGVRLEKNIDRSVSITPRTGRRLDFMFIALLVIALGVSVTLNVTGMRDAPEIEVASPEERLSIAVLPFTSRSTDPENQLFADGIHDDLLTRLANIGALRVISRTSMMEYRDTTKNLRQVGEELGVGTVLEGAVQRVGDNVRITAQLIDASTDEHLWANSYDRQLSMANLFAIQSEISAEITRALQTTLTDEEQTRLAVIPTDSLAAYNLYTQGRDNLYKRRLETLLEARAQFEAAIELDPNYAEAYAGLAESVLLILNNHQAISTDEAFGIAEASLDKAVSLNPELSQAHAAEGLMKTMAWQETRSGPGLEEAEACLTAALDLNPNNASAWMWFASLRDNQRRTEEAIDLYHESLRVDPLGKIPYANLPGMYAQRGQNQEALDLYVKAVEIHPDWPTAYRNLSAHLQALGRMDESVAWGMKGAELSADPLGGASMTSAYMEFGEYQKILELFSGVTEEHPMYGYGASMEMAIMGDFAGAAEVAERAIEGVENPRQFQLSLIAVFAVFAGDFDKARKYAELHDPEFAADADPTVTRYNVTDLVRYAFILQNQGEGERAYSLLNLALDVVRTLPRIGIFGHGIRDVQILALQGRTVEALAAFRDAIDEGFRGTASSNGWPMALDPYLGSLRGQPAFEAMVGELEEAIARMQQNVAEAEQTGDWDSLRAATLTETT
ncbi:MAG: tetratricopeptide repeat protein [Gammaproteobacteria bacterium]|jgi:TolB-like protein/tetratricopeptide (TPR) repeat protein|nr:tetratricopeptide repeat protein [Gammaproteobacteria bacterium]